MAIKLKDQDPTTLKIIFSFIGIILATLIILIIYSINQFINYLNSPAYELSSQQTQITNLSELSKGRPQDSDLIIYIQNKLYLTIQYNTKDIDPTQITDVSIRDNTFRQEDDSSGLHTVSFIVDIPSLRQTYSIQYQWNTEDESEVPEWGTYVKCPTKDQLIYPAFQCTDEYIKIATEDKGLTINWDNSYQLDYTFNENASLLIRQALNQFITKTYSSSANISNLIATINETTFHAIDSSLGIYYFDLNLSNYQTYNVTVCVIQNYDTIDIALYAKNTKNEDSYATIISNDTDSNSSFADWFRNFLNLPDLPITVQTPEELNNTEEGAAM